jgi:hypothetical protein
MMRIPRINPAADSQVRPGKDRERFKGGKRTCGKDCEKARSKGREFQRT